VIEVTVLPLLLSVGFEFEKSGSFSQSDDLKNQQLALTSAIERGKMKLPPGWLMSSWLCPQPLIHRTA
jgi:hypothetical protein